MKRHCDSVRCHPPCHHGPRPPSPPRPHRLRIRYPNEADGHDGPRPGPLANALRLRAIDAVEQAKSGQPGLPIGVADIAEVRWRHHLRRNPADPSWPSGHQLVLSNGLGSLLLYGLLHRTGYDLPPEELKRSQDYWKEYRALLERFGGYDKITPEAWAQYYADYAAWQIARKSRTVRP